MHGYADAGRGKEQRHHEMIFQMLADMGRVHDTGHAHGFQLAPRPNAGEEQHVWRADRPRAQDHLFARICRTHLA